MRVAQITGMLGLVDSFPEVLAVAFPLRKSKFVSTSLFHETHDSFLQSTYCYSGAPRSRLVVGWTGKRAAGSQALPAKPLPPPAATSVLREVNNRSVGKNRNALFSGG